MNTIAQGKSMMSTVYIHKPIDWLGESLPDVERVIFSRIKLQILEYLSMESLNTELMLKIIDECNQPAISMYVLKEVVELLRIKLLSSTSKKVYLTITLVDSLVKNCGTKIHVLVGEQMFMTTLSKISRVWLRGFGSKSKMVGNYGLDTIQAWGEGFESRKYLYPHIYGTYTKLRAKSYIKFPGIQYDHRRVPIFLGPISQHEKEFVADYLLENQQMDDTDLLFFNESDDEDESGDHDHQQQQHHHDTHPAPHSHEHHDHFFGKTMDTDHHYHEAPPPVNKNVSSNHFNTAAAAASHAPNAATNPPALPPKPNGQTNLHSQNSSFSSTGSGTPDFLSDAFGSNNNSNNYSGNNNNNNQKSDLFSFQQVAAPAAAPVPPPPPPKPSRIAVVEEKDPKSSFDWNQFNTQPQTQNNYANVGNQTDAFGFGFGSGNNNGNPFGNTNFGTNANGNGNSNFANFANFDSFSTVPSSSSSTGSSLNIINSTDYYPSSRREDTSNLSSKNDQFNNSDNDTMGKDKKDMSHPRNQMIHEIQQVKLRPTGRNTCDENNPRNSPNTTRGDAYDGSDPNNPHGKKSSSSAFYDPSSDPKNHVVFYGNQRVIKREG